jgi:hypothetical protein
MRACRSTQSIPSDRPRSRSIWRCAKIPGDYERPDEFVECAPQELWSKASRRERQAHTETIRRSGPTLDWNSTTRPRSLDAVPTRPSDGNREASKVPRFEIVGSPPRKHSSAPPVRIVLKKLYRCTPGICRRTMHFRTKLAPPVGSRAGYRGRACWDV